MATKRTRAAKAKLVEQFGVGTTGGGCQDVNVRHIRIKGPKTVTVGKEFTLVIETDPPVDAFPIVTICKGTPYTYHTRRLKRDEIQDRAFRTHQVGTVAYPKGVYYPIYGLVNVSKGVGRIQITQFSHESFALKVTLNGAEAVWSISRKNIRLGRKAAKG